MHFKLRNVCFALIAVAIISTTGHAQSQEDKTLAPYFFVQGDPSVDKLPLKGTNVEVSISGVIADVKVTQTYRNEGTRPINASYVFPASTRAAVYAMRMKLGNEVIVAKIKEKETAKKEFEEAKQEGKSASLLEEERPNVFSMHLANLMPQEQVDIELHYTELLVPTDGTYEFVFPTVVGPRYQSPNDENKSNAKFVSAPYLHEGEKPTSTLHITAKVSAGMPIQEINCTSHQIFPQFINPTVAQLTLDDSDPFQGNRDFILHYRLLGQQISSGLLLFQGEDENFFLYMAQPPARVATEEIPPREYIFVVDVSGSMNGYPLNTAKHLVNDLIGNLKPTDLFNVVLFAGDANVLSANSLPANKENVDKAFQLLDAQRGAGGTELLAAIQQAMSIPRQKEISRNVVVITDGYVSGEEGVFDYIRTNLGQSNLFAFGIGDSVNRYLIEGMAKAGMGEPFIVSDEKSANAVADKFREYIQTPVLTDIQIKTPGFETYDVHPTHFPDLLAQRPIILFGKWRGPITGAIELTGRSGRGDFITRLDVNGLQPEESNRALRYLWARSRIAELSDYGSSNVRSDQAKEITKLGLQYSLLTQYTSFIAVREVVTNPLGSAEDINQPLPLPIRVSDMAVGGTDQGSEPELIVLLVASLLIVSFMVLRKRLLGRRSVDIV
ncbi:MAG TPA: VIT domain-containing protein [Pyrinomonadaceae bacterium]